MRSAVLFAMYQAPLPHDWFHPVSLLQSGSGLLPVLRSGFGPASTASQWAAALLLSYRRPAIIWLSLPRTSWSPVTAPATDAPGIKFIDHIPGIDPVCLFGATFYRWHSAASRHNRTLLTHLQDSNLAARRWIYATQDRPVIFSRSTSPPLPGARRVARLSELSSPHRLRNEQEASLQNLHELCGASV